MGGYYDYRYGCEHECEHECRHERRCGCGCGCGNNNILQTLLLLSFFRGGGFFGC